MKQITVALMMLVCAACVSENKYESRERYVDARLEALSDDLKELKTQLMSHLCEFHKDEYDCVTFTDFALKDE